MTHYETLQISTDADFKRIKKAYFKRAKECHPDRHNNSRVKEEEFKMVVAAFDVLSDPEKKQRYDESLGMFKQEDYQESRTRRVFSKHSIMDTPADDTLEELIVGNRVPKNATLATLMLDLERTDIFITFREGKSLFFNKKYVQAITYFRKVVAHSPNNILYRCFFARSLAFTGKYSQAKRHYQAAIDIGERRNPPQYLAQIRKELRAVQKKQLPWWNNLIGFFKGNTADNFITGVDEQLIDRTNATIDKMLREGKKEKKGKKQNKLLE